MHSGCCRRVLRRGEGAFPRPSLFPFLPQVLENLPLEGKILRALISPGRVALIRRHEVVSEA